MCALKRIRPEEGEASVEFHRAPVIGARISADQFWARLLLMCSAFSRDECNLFSQRFYDFDASIPLFNLDFVFKVFS